MLQNCMIFSIRLLSLQITIPLCCSHTVTANKNGLPLQPEDIF